jgi:hypothetical protein
MQNTFGMNYNHTNLSVTIVDMHRYLDESYCNNDKQQQQQQQLTAINTTIAANGAVLLHNFTHAGTTAVDMVCFVLFGSMKWNTAIGFVGDQRCFLSTYHSNGASKLAREEDPKSLYVCYVRMRYPY